MKRLFTFLVSILFSISLFAYNGNRLSISASAAGSELKIEINGQQFTMKNKSITLRHLRDGYHDVKIFREAKRNRFGFGRREIIFNNTVVLKRGFHVDITVNRFGKVMVDERRIDRYDDWYIEEDDYFDNEGWGGNRNVMTSSELEQVKESLRKEWFENNRLASAKFIIERNNFTSAQVKELMLLFTFENNRLEVAKLAYRKTVDQHNYYLVNDALNFNSSKEELARFIRESR